MKWKKFNAMGTEVIISASLGDGQEAILDEAESLIRAFEKRFSRFNAESELSRLNNAPAGEVAASPEMIAILKEAKNLHLETGGIFDPTVIGSLEKVGYNKSFNEIGGGAGVGVDTEKIKQEFLARPKMNELEIFESKVIKPEGFKIDLGGIGKGDVSDLLGGGLFAGVGNFWISAGGDLVVKGNNEGETGWRVGVQDPNDAGKEIFSLKTKGEEVGIATSGIFKRKGEVGGFKWHHLIDPQTGLPVENNILAVTAISSTATRADVFAKTVLVSGAEKGLEFIESQEDSACVIFLKNGEVTLSKRAVKYF